MPKVLTEAEVDTLGEEVDAAMAAAMGEEPGIPTQVLPTQTIGDLSDGGMVNGVRITPMANRQKLERGRPVARRAWMWDGTETLLPLAWSPDGKRHDGGRHYLLKRHCLCCKTGGFQGRQCPNCAKSECSWCGAGADGKKVIPCFYLRKQDVPFPAKFYGDVDCFLAFCPRRGGRGFKTEQEMRVHAGTRHKMEYHAYLESLAESRRDDLSAMQGRIDTLTVALATLTNGRGRAGKRKQSVRTRKANTRTAKVQHDAAG